jgi:hypothetical protein
MKYINSITTLWGPFGCGLMLNTVGIYKPHRLYQELYSKYVLKETLNRRWALTDEKDK